MDDLLDRRRRRAPHDRERWRAFRRRFHFWAAVAFSAWCALVTAIIVAGIGAGERAGRAEIGGAVVFGALAIVMANVARIRRRRIR